MARYSQDDDPSGFQTGEGLNNYLGDFFGGDQGSPRYGVTDPPVRAEGPQINAPGYLSPEEGYRLAHESPTGTYISTPGPLYNNYGQRNDTPQQSLLQVYQGVQANTGPTDDAARQLLNAYTTQGYNAAPYMYGDTPSGNELLINGQKTKFVSGGNFGDPGASWYEWGSNDQGSGGGGGGTSGGGGAPSGGTGFADPAYNQLNDLVQKRLAALNQPQSFPQLDAYMSMLQQQQAQARQRAQMFADQLTGRISELQKPLLSQGDVVQQHALASNNLLAQRDAALKNAKESLYARGFEPTSGLQEGTNRSIAESYVGAQSNIDAQLQQMAIKQDEQRRNQATQLQGLVAQALAGGDVAALQSAAQMADLENQQFNIDQNRQREQLTTANIPVDLTNMGFANALNASNSNQNPLGALFSLAQLGQGQQGLQMQQSNSNMGALAWLLQTVLG